VKEATSSRPGPEKSKFKEESHFRKAKGGGTCDDMQTEKPNESFHFFQSSKKFLEWEEGRLTTEGKHLRPARSAPKVPKSRKQEPKHTSPERGERSFSPSGKNADLGRNKEKKAAHRINGKANGYRKESSTYHHPKKDCVLPDK